MTNRQKLIETNIYDLLCTLHDNMLDMFAFCVMEILPGKYEECPYQGDKHRCGDCIQNWLNEEAK